MNVIIERVLVVPTEYLEDYGMDGHCLHLKVRAVYRMGLENLSDQVNRGDYRKLPVHPIHTACAFLKDESSWIMYNYAFRMALIPDQLGLVICNVDGIRTLHRVC